MKRVNNNINKPFALRNRSFKVVFLLALLGVCYVPSFAQSVSVTQNLSFGTFCPTNNSGGTVSVDFNGNRTFSGNIFLFNSTFNEAIFTFSAGNKNRNIYLITTNSPRTLSRTGGGGSMTLTLDTPSPATLTVKRNKSASFSIGGTLTVGGIIANPPGDYSGTFRLTVNYN